MINVKICKMITLLLAISFIMFSSEEATASDLVEEILELAKKAPLVKQLNEAIALIPENPDQAVQRCQNLADQGLPEAKETLPTFRYHAGQAYLLGSSIDKDCVKAFDYFKLAKDAKEPNTIKFWSSICLRISQGYYSGNGAPRNFEKAIQFCQTAYKETSDEELKNLAKQQMQEYCWGLAKQHSTGKGDDIPQDPILAYNFCKLAAQYDYQEAKNKLGHFQGLLATGYFEGKTVDQNFEKALQHLTAAKENGFSQYDKLLPTFQFALAGGYATSRGGVGENHEKAISLFEELSKGNSPYKDIARNNYEALKRGTGDIIVWRKES